ncbi:hypothetical protein HaLaN_05080, partial [Haematococcus lacustris]
MMRLKDNMFAMGVIHEPACQFLTRVGTCWGLQMHKAASMYWLCLLSTVLAARGSRRQWDVSGGVQRLVPLKASNDRSVGMAGPRADVRSSRSPRAQCCAAARRPAGAPPATG